MPLIRKIIVALNGAILLSETSQHFENFEFVILLRSVLSNYLSVISENNIKISLLWLITFVGLANIDIINK